jgi:hypothetical protein
MRCCAARQSRTWRSIPGLVFPLAMHVERAPWCATALALVLGGLVWSRPALDRSPAPGGRALQVAVLKDGFALTYTGDAGRRVVELDAQGQRRREIALDMQDELRLVGTGAGSVVGWQRGAKVLLASVDAIADVDTWGKSVRQLCDGVATNGMRFGIGWLEGDDGVWVVHGPLDGTAAGAGEGAPMRIATGMARNDWCGVASAERNIALMWRSGDRMAITMCSKKACSNLPASFTLDRRLPVLGAGCVRNLCLLATRDEAGRARVSLLATTGRIRWNQPLAASGAVSIVGVGDRGFAVGFAGPEGAAVIKLDRDGKATPLWRDPAAGAPALAWSGGRLAIARFRGDELMYDTIALAP